MHWFAPPPWIRWSLSIVLVIAAFAVEVAGPKTTGHWFAIADIEAGTQLRPDLFRSVQIPSGLLPDAQPEGYARVEIREGDPLITGQVTNQPARAPEGWWAIELSVPGHVRPGQNVHLVLLSTDQTTIVTGITLTVETRSDAFGGASALATIAIPAEAAADVAVASEAGKVTVLTTND
ncbi:MAG: hypothetical protein JJE47_17580 [Acidimicrobiia bacterium]|nr:hypothetical protein [Acidimicrobiia bacterium]